MVHVVAALIWRGDRFLICQRPAHKARGLLWEFVGGKVEKGESPEGALVRECREELDIGLAVEDVFMALDHVYPDITIRLTLYNARILSGEPKKLEHNDIRWITPEEIDGYEFCPADAEILKRLKAMKRQGG
jgi:8-oxo-dGTP diphosphatase